MANANGTLLPAFSEIEQIAANSGIAFIPASECRHKYKDDEVVRREYSHGVYYTGSVTALIRGRFIEKHMLPGQPGRNKTSVTLPPSTWGKGMIDRLRISKSTDRIYTIYASLSKAEADRRWHAIRAATAAAESEKLAADFKADAIKRLQFFLGVVRRKLMTETGYGFDDSTLCEFERVTEDLEEVLKAGAIAQGRDLLCEEPSPAEFNSPKQDAALQRFLRVVTSNISLVQNENPEAI